MKKILIILPNNLGDVIMALPVLAGLKAEDTPCHITFFVEEGFEGGLVNIEFCDRIFLFPRKSIRDLTRSSDWQDGIKKLSDLISELKAEQFSLVLNLSQHSYTHYIASILDSSEIRGRQYLRTGNQAVLDNWSQYLYAIPFSRQINMLHASDVYKRIAGVRGCVSKKLIRIGKDEREKAMNYLQNAGFSSQSRIAVFQPGAAVGAKRWEPKNFVELGKMLIDDGYKLLVTGAPAERETAESIMRQLGQSCHSSAGKVSFRETIALVDLCEVCVTGDTALMHAASALGKRVYALFGPTNPVETGPYGDGHIIFSGLCSSRPCFCFNCTAKTCMESITPRSIYSGINGRFNEIKGCDVYRTSIDQNGTYRLLPLLPESVPYFDPKGADLVRRCFESSDSIPLEDVLTDEYLNQAEEFCASVEEIERALDCFLRDKRIEHIRRYDEFRQAMNNSTGIKAFWNAILNIRLNNIAILNAKDSIMECRRACMLTRLQISSALSRR
jgi:ADP-heptose:LPS heptosyltransferase